MMFVIEARRETHNRIWKWISGVFLDRSDADAYFESIPDELKCLQRLYSIPFSGYPLYMIEAYDFRFWPFADERCLTAYEGAADGDFLHSGRSDAS